MDSFEYDNLNLSKLYQQDLLLKQDLAPPAVAEYLHYSCKYQMRFPPVQPPHGQWYIC